MIDNQSNSAKMGKSSPTQNNTTVTDNEPLDVAETIVESSTEETPPKIQNQRKKVKTKIKRPSSKFFTTILRKWQTMIMIDESDMDLKSYYVTIAIYIPYRLNSLPRKIHNRGVSSLGGTFYDISFLT